MKIQSNINTGFAKSKVRLCLFAGALLLASFSMASCNSNSGKTTASHDTSSAVSSRVDTMGSGSKQP